jgi:formiminotetrahydrofolate cyclodeaminase
MTPPADIGGAALAVLRLTAELANVGNPTVASDAGCAALLAEAAVRCASLNVLANVVLLRDAAVGAAARAAAQARDEEATEVCRQVLAVVYARMGA